MMNEMTMEKALEILDNMTAEEMEAAKRGVLPMQPLTEEEQEEARFEDMWATYEEAVAENEAEALAEAKAHAERKIKKSLRRKQSYIKTNRKREIAKNVSWDRLGFEVNERGAIKHDGFDLKAVKKAANKKCRQMDLPQHGGYKKAFKVTYCS